MLHEVTSIGDSYRSYVSSGPDHDSRPIVSYKPVGMCGIEVGYSAIIVPVDHYSATHVANGEIARTTPVLAHDKATGAFETRNTRYILDSGYEH